MKKLLHKVIEIAMPYKGWYLLSTSISIILIALDLCFAQNSKLLFDSVPGITVDRAIHIIIVFVIISASQYLFNFCNGWIDSYINESIVYKMRKDILGKVERLPIQFFDKNHSSQVMSIF